MINILFVCIGNTCRSVMAEYLFKNLLLEKNLLSKFNVKSCGISANNNDPPTQNTIDVIYNDNADITNHKATLINKDLIKESNYIFTMDNSILKYINLIFSDYITGQIAPISNEGILDPYGTSLENYTLCKETITLHLKNILSSIIKNEKL